MSLVEIRGGIGKREVNSVPSFRNLQFSDTEQKDFIKLPRNITPLILQGDVIESLKRIQDNCISVIVTSPPYWGLRDYGIENQIGQELTPEDYINKMLDVTFELRRVTKKDGCFFLNVGDSYFNGNLQMIPYRLSLGIQKQGWKLRNVIIWHKPNHMPSPVKNRFSNTWEPIFFFVKNQETKKYYFNLDNVRVEHKTKEEKKSDLPRTLSIQEFNSLKDKFGLRALPLLGGDYIGKFSNTKKINLGASPGARSVVNGEYYSLQRRFSIDDKLKFEIINFLREKRKNKKVSHKDIDEHFGYKDTAGHWFRLDESGSSLPKPEDWVRLKKFLDLDDRYDRVMTEQHYVLQTVLQHPNGKNPGDMWQIPTEKIKDAHFAIFPEELPRRAIKACCPKDGFVLDPFAGSGTTGKVAMELGRKSLLIELNRRYVEIIKKRCNMDIKRLSDFVDYGKG